MDQFLNSANYTLVEFSAAIIVLNLVLSFLASLVVVWVYQYTHRSLSYSQSFIISMVMISVLATAAMMILGNNLIRALGILGVFTLLRFRTIVKDTKDATYIFFTLAVGMAIGTNNYIIALFTVVLLGIFLVILHKFNFGSNIRMGYLVTIVGKSSMKQEYFDDILKKYSSHYKLLQLKEISDHSKEFNFRIKFKDKDTEDTFLADMRKIEDVELIDITSGEEAAEY